MTTNIKIPRPHRKRLKSLDSFQELNRWGGDIDARINEIISSLESTQRAIREVTRTTGAASIGLHASTHRPASGTDPLVTAAPISTLGGTSSNSIGTGNSFARNDHSHDVGTAAPAFVLGTSASEGSSNNLSRVDSGIALFDVTAPADLAASAATGSAAFAARRDHVHLFPTALRATANASTLTLTDDATDQTLTASLGLLKIVPGTGIDINFPNSTAASLIIRPNTTTAAALVVSVQGRPVAGTRTLMQPNWFQPISTDIFSGQTFRTWDVSGAPGIGQHTSDTFVGYDISAMSISPSVGSGAGNKAYGYRALTNALLIGNTNATWDEVAMAYFAAPTRSFGQNPTITVSAGLITEPAVVGGTKQVGLLVRQRAAQQVATDRLGIDIEAQNSGTNQWGLRSGNRIEISSPAARAESVLLLKQLATGATAGAHANFDDKAGDPPAPVTGDLWRNGDGLWFRQAAASVNLTAAAGGGDSITVNGVAVVDADFDSATPAAPASPLGDGQNVTWQKDASSPANISAYVNRSAFLGIMEATSLGFNMA